MRCSYCLICHVEPMRFYIFARYRCVVICLWLFTESQVKCYLFISSIQRPMISYRTSFITLVVSLHLEVVPLWGIVLRGNGIVLNRVLSAHSIYPVWMIWIVLWASKWSIFLISKQCGFLFSPKCCLGALWHEVHLCAKSVAQECGVMPKHALEKNLSASVVA